MRIATGNSFRSCGLQFGYGKSTAKCICEEFEKALARKKDQFMQFPVTRENIQNYIDEFEEKYGIPQIVGVIDGCHIEINAPPFGMLKGRCRIVMKKIEQKMPNVNIATIAACVLHNICILLNDEYDVDESDSDGDDSSDDGRDFEPASDMRNAMKDYVWNNL